MENLVFGYWGIKGLGEFTRLTLAAIGQAYTEENPASPQEWGTKAGELAGAGLHFPNLPYIKDGDFYLSESQTIPLYVCMKAGKFELLGGKDLVKNSRIAEIMGVMGDCRMEVFKHIMGPEYKAGLAKAGKAGEKLDRKLMFLSKFLGENDFFLGDFTLADIYVGYSLYLVSNFILSGEAEDPVSRYPNLVAHRARLFEQPGIKEHVASDAWKKPLFPPQMFPWVKEHELK